MHIKNAADLPIAEFDEIITDMMEYGFFAELRGNDLYIERVAVV